LPHEALTQPDGTVARRPPHPLPLVSPQAAGQQALRERIRGRYRRLLSSALADQPSIATIVAVTEAAHHDADRMIDDASAASQLPPRACTAGCGYCCHTWVVAPVADVVLIAEQIRTATGRRSMLIPELERRAEELSGLLTAERSRRRRPCVWLDAGSQRCRIYGSRPLPCRGWHAFDVGPCAARHADPAGDHAAQVWPTQQTITDGIAGGLVAGLQEAGVVAYFVDFELGLRIALRTEDVLGRWLEGEDVFAEAAVDVGRSLT
jgi:hypothetical protein